MRSIIATIGLALMLSACGGVFDFTSGADTPGEKLNAAKGYYALALEGVNSLHDAQVISDNTLVNVIAPVQGRARVSINEAELVLSRFGGENNELVEESIRSASRLSLEFYNLYLELK